MSDFAVSTAFQAEGNIIKFFGKAEAGSKKFGNTTVNAFNRSSRAGSRFGDIVKGILVTDVIKGSLRGLTMGLRAATDQFIDYDAAITQASAKFKGLNLATEQGQKQFEQMKQAARGLGATTEFSATQAAQGLDFLAMAGFNVNQALATLPGIVDLATAAGTDLARATDIASDSLGIFGLMTKDTAQLTTNMSRINDVFAKTTTTANTTMEALFESAVKGGTSFTNAGQSIETFSALAGVMADNGIKGAESGTSLRNVILRLADATPKAAKVMRGLGVDIKDQNNDFRDVIDILADFEKGLSGMGSAQRTAALSTVFGARAVNGVNVLLQKGTDALRDYRAGLEESGGVSEQIANRIRQSFGNQLAGLKSASIELGFQFIDTFEDKIGPAIQSVTKLIRNFDLGALSDQISTMMPLVRGMIAGFAVFFGIMAIERIIAAVNAFKLMAIAIKAAAASQGILNAVMAASPIVLIAKIIGVLAAFAVPLLIDGWDKFADAVSATIDFILKPLKAFSTVIDAITGADDEADGAAAVPPNRAALQAQQIQFNGRIDIAGAPEGSTAESETRGAPPIDMEMAGVNP